MTAGRMVRASVLLACCTAVMLGTHAAGAGGGKYTLLQLPENGMGARPRRVYANQAGAVAVGEMTGAGGKFEPVLWSYSPADWFAQQYSVLSLGRSATIHAAAFQNSVADGCLVGTAQDGGGTDRAVLWRGGLPGATPVGLLPFPEPSAATDVVRLPSAAGSSADRYGVVGTMELADGSTRGFFCVPQVEDEVVLLFVGQLPTLGGPSSEATSVARTAAGVRIVGRAQNAQGQWRPCKWEGPDFDAIQSARGPRVEADAVEYGLITALTAPGEGTVLDIDPTANFAVGAAKNAQGVSVPAAWKSAGQGAFVPVSIPTPRGTVDGAATGVDEAGRIVAYYVVQRRGEDRLVSLRASATGSKPVIVDLRIRRGRGEFRNDFLFRRPTSISGGVISGFGPRKERGGTLSPFLLLPR